MTTINDNNNDVIRYVDMETINLDKVVDIYVEDADDYPDFADAYIAEASYEYAPGKYVALTNEQLEDLCIYHPDFVYECALDQVF